ALQSRRTLSRSGTEQGTDVAGDGALPLVGTTPIMQELYRTIARIMNSDLPILVSGESGTGKSLIAKLLHNFSDRRNLPFVSVGADDLTDLDGPAKVLARAKGGTIVFEEIGDFPTNVQARIVTMIDNSGEHAPRFIGTLQGDVPSALSDGLVRDDLYYRIAGATIDVPSLRERVEDIALLADHVLAKLDRDGASTGRLSDDALDLMRKYVWPGNVRQLENIVRRLGLTAQETSISKAEVEAALRMQPEADKLPHRGGEKLNADVERHLRRYFELHGGDLPPPGLHARVLREVEAPMIEIALDATGGNQAKCADLLGINRNTLRKKINELDIKVTRRRKLM
ncbi:MAG: nitrogen regulation protein NR(I), partial [Rhodobacteraceae bacterium]|nr:nitrogen regulation protein NR(I) [Paracoccaceae bacterium]